MLATVHTPLRVLLLDGHHPQALATLRSLGRRRARVTVASPQPHAPALVSRYCAEFLQSPDPLQGQPSFLRWLFATLRRERYDTMLFCSAHTAETLVAHANTLRLYSRCALPQPHILHDLSRRRSLADFLATLNLGLTTGPTGTGVGGVDYAMVAITRRGEPVATFLHRLRAGPDDHSFPWYERQAMESVEHGEVRRLGLALLQQSGWDGIATLGFRHDLERNALSLLGIHPVWSDGLELAIASGIDLPWLYAQLAAGNPITGPTRYRLGLRYVRLITPGSRAPLHARTLGVFAAMRPDVRSDLVVRDPLPSIPLLGRTVLWLRRRLRWRAARRRPPKLEVLSGGELPRAPTSHPASSPEPVVLGPDAGRRGRSVGVRTW